MSTGIFEQLAKDQQTQSNPHYRTLSDENRKLKGQIGELVTQLDHVRKQYRILHEGSRRLVKYLQGLPPCEFKLPESIGISGVGDGTEF